MAKKETEDQAAEALAPEDEAVEGEAVGGEGADAPEATEDGPDGDGGSEVPPDGGRGSRKVRVGVVSSDRQDKTVTVKVERTMAHPLYGKRVSRTKKYHAHDENNEYQVGDTVRISETRPLSKTKRWRVVQLLDRAESE